MAFAVSLNSTGCIIYLQITAKLALVPKTLSRLPRLL